MHLIVIEHRFVKGFISRDHASQLVMAQPDSILIRFSETDPDFLTIAFVDTINGKKLDIRLHSKIIIFVPSELQKIL